MCLALCQAQRYQTESAVCDWINSLSPIQACACWISRDFRGLTSECIPPLVSANQRTCSEDPTLAMGWTPSTHPRSSSSWCRTWRPPAATHEGQSWEGVLCQVDRTVLLALYLDHWAAGERGKINGGMQSDVLFTARNINNLEPSENPSN